MRFDRRVFAPDDGTGSAPVAEAATPAPATDDEIMAAILSPVEEAPKAKEKPAATQKQEPVTTDAPRGATDDQTKSLEASGDATEAGAGAGSDGDADADDDDFDPFENTTTVTQEQSSEEDEGDDAVAHRVTVDGEEVEVTLGELKRRYSGEGAIEKRLQAATRTKQEADADRQAAAQVRRETEEAASASREQLAHAITALKAVLTQPRVKAPDPGLKTSNPARYVAELEAYQAERAMLGQRGAQLDTLIQTHQETQQQRMAELRRSEAEALVKAMPVFADPVKGARTKDMIYAAAKAVGFTEADIAGAADHRLFILATKAAMYDNIVAKAKGGRSKALPQTVVPGKGSANAQPKNPVRVQAAKQAALVAKAEKTGDVDDIAATLVVPKRK